MTSVTATTTEATHPVDQVLPFPQMFVYGLAQRQSSARRRAEVDE